MFSWNMEDVANPQALFGDLVKYGFDTVFQTFSRDLSTDEILNYMEGANASNIDVYGLEETNTVYIWGQA